MTIVLPDMAAAFTPMVYAVPVQLLAYHTAVVMGTDVDQPRNLAEIGHGRIVASPVWRRPFKNLLGWLSWSIRPAGPSYLEPQMTPDDPSAELYPRVNPPPDAPRGLMARFRNYFLTGLVVAGPIAITVLPDLVVRELGRQSGPPVRADAPTGRKPICRSGCPAPA